MEHFARPIVHYVQSLKLLQKLEIYLQGMNGTVILILFIFLFLITEAQGIYAGTLLLRGKIPIVAFTFWLFRVTKPKLMAFGWLEKVFIKKNYMREGDSTQKKFKQIYIRLNI